jgi:PAS domain S-box-containing protein
MYGFSISDFKTQKCVNLKDFSIQPQISAIVDQCISQKKTIMYETKTNTSFGYKIWTQTALTPILNDNGEIVKLVAIDSDITKIKEAEEEIMIKNSELEEKNLLITDSINYAKTIQEAILPNEKKIKISFPDSFIYYRPRDIVSGDFYWFGELNDLQYFAVVDCTGHGVPGGFMSMIGNTLLNEIILEKKITLPSDILNELNTKVIAVLNKGSDIITHQEDGMDITVCRIDKRKHEIQIALANHTAFLIANGETVIVDGDIYSIGETLTQRENHQYVNQIFTYIEGTSLFMFSDGFKDQFGGPENRKFSQDRLQKLMEAGSHQSMKELGADMEAVFENWKKDEPQLDDVLVVGFKLT